MNLVTKELFRVCRTAADYVALPAEQLEEIIQSTGFFRAKAKNIRAACAALVERHGGEVPADMTALTALAGVGRKTANVVLGNVFGINEGVVVDTHVQRLSARLRLTKHNDAQKIERDLMKLIPRAKWALFSHWLIWRRRRCFAQPRLRRLRNEALPHRLSARSAAARKIQPLTTRRARSLAAKLMAAERSDRLRPRNPRPPIRSRKA